MLSVLLIPAVLVDQGNMSQERMGSASSVGRASVGSPAIASSSLDADAVLSTCLRRLMHFLEN